MDSSFEVCRLKFSPFLYDKPTKSEEFQSEESSLPLYLFLNCNNIPVVAKVLNKSAKALRFRRWMFFLAIVRFSAG